MAGRAEPAIRKANPFLASGACQGSCRLIYAAIGCITFSKWALMTQSRSGISMLADVLQKMYYWRECSTRKMSITSLPTWYTTM